ncbi:hypothetical protein FOS14_16495 [Skermania sp. ID1734]|uniref:DUF7937 domain-containing protein n=1 Tax=Skermania sp. ID1734 TaxID=2597516 RepID=UPI00117FA06B|nr:hypothetical protein [Skermania sp. ID1734]TSD96641.1 hypothetical protein FOS14_16495 [Skermania sp. ID1734]
MASAPKRSLFAGIAVSDYVRDGIAALLLFIAMFLPWNSEFSFTGGGFAGLILLVILLTLLSIASLALPYVARLGMLGPNWHVAQVRMIRLLVNLPYALMIIGFLLWDVVASLWVFSNADAGPGIGSAMIFGAAGVVLAAQPRASEIEASSMIPARWSAGVRGLAIAALALTVISALLDLVAILTTAHQHDAETSDTLRILVLALLLVASSIAIVTVVVLGVIRGLASARIALMGVALAFVVASFFSAFIVEVRFDFFLASPAYMGAVLLVAAGVAATTPGQVFNDYGSTHPGYTWLRAARGLLLLMAVWNFADAIVSIGRAIVVATYSNEYGTPPLGVGASAALAVFSLLSGALSTVGTMMVRPRQGATDPRPAREMILGICLGLFVLTVARLIALSVMGGAAALFTRELVLPILPILVAVGILAAKPVRSLYQGVPLFAMATGGTASAMQAGAMPTSAQPQMAQPTHAFSRPQSGPFISTTPPPAVPTPATSVASSATTDADALAAANPQTPQAELARLAQARPDLRPAIAANPNTYPELIGWLQALGDPAVNSALAQRLYG